MAAAHFTAGDPIPDGAGIPPGAGSPAAGPNITVQYRLTGEEAIVQTVKKEVRARRKDGKVFRSQMRDQAMSPDQYDLYMRATEGLMLSDTESENEGCDSFSSSETNEYDSGAEEYPWTESEHPRRKRCRRSLAAHDSDAESYDLDSERGSQLRRTQRRRRPASSDEFCFMCHVDPESIEQVVSKELPKIHPWIEELIAGYQEDQAPITEVVAQLYVLFNFCIRPYIRWLYSIRSLGRIPPPRWTVRAILSHLLRHRPVAEFRSQVSAMQIEHVLNAAANSVVPVDPSLPLNKENALLLERFMKLRFLLLQQQHGNAAKIASK